MKTVESALETAIAYGDLSETTDLLNALPKALNARFDDNVGLTPLMWACRNRHSLIVEMLLQRGAQVNAVNPVEHNGEGGNTALWFASQGALPGNSSSAKLLLEYGADIDTQCEFGTTAFQAAVSWVHLELAQLLISKGANHSLKNASGRTALEQIVKDFEMLKTLSVETEDLRRFEARAPRMIDYLETLPRFK